MTGDNNGERKQQPGTMRCSKAPHVFSVTHLKWGVKINDETNSSSAEVYGM